MSDPGFEADGESSEGITLSGDETSLDSPSAFLQGLERLQESGNFKGYGEERAKLSRLEHDLSESERAQLEALDARHATDPLARRMLSVTVIVLVVIAIRLWLMG